MTDDECVPTPDDGPPTVVGQWMGALFGFRRLNAAAFARVTERTGLPESSLHVLGFLHQQSGHGAPMSHLARHLGFSPAGITPVTARLARAGLLERHPCPADRRVVYAVLSADGVVAADRATDVLTDALNELVVARTGEADLARLAGIVAKARSGLDPTR